MLYLGSSKLSFHFFREVPISNGAPSAGATAARSLGSVIVITKTVATPLSLKSCYELKVGGNRGRGRH